jgi:hypothetical protein
MTHIHFYIREFERCLKACSALKGKMFTHDRRDICRKCGKREAVEAIIATAARDHGRSILPRHDLVANNIRTCR